ncbi:hypothetical protein [Rodentibacter trehalosifermentans]|nr:hypothetical protein [Rodentibacter trehalosifermentans]
MLNIKRIKIKEEINKIGSPSNNNEKMLSSHRAIIKGLLLVIDKIHNKKRIFSSPRGKITTNEISKEILTIIEENPYDFLDDKIKDRTIRKYLGDILKKIEDN